MKLTIFSSFIDFFKDFNQNYNTRKNAIQAMECLYNIIENNMLAQHLKVSHYSALSNRSTFFKILKECPDIVKHPVNYERRGIGHLKYQKKQINEYIIESAIKSKDLDIIENTLNAFIASKAFSSTLSIPKQSLAYLSITHLNIFNLVIEKGGRFSDVEYQLLKTCQTSYDKNQNIDGLKGQEQINEILNRYEAYLEKDKLELTLSKKTEHEKPHKKQKI